MIANEQYLNDNMATEYWKQFIKRYLLINLLTLRMDLHTSWSAGSVGMRIRIQEGKSDT
jgi:hypothetical protein